jgi:hypothetical protein
MNINELPEYFAIKRDAKNPLWNKYIKWLNKTYNLSLTGNATVHIYYGWAGEKDNLSCYHNNILDFPNPVTELTLEQWDNIVNNTFVLPEKWFVQRDKSNYKIINNWFEINLPLKDNHWCGYSGYMNYPRLTSQVPNLLLRDLLKNNYTEITSEQFCKYVLKQENMNKEIIGYKLIKPEYKEAAIKLGGETLCYNFDIKFNPDATAVKKWKEAGVLDLWFTPVFKEEKTLPMINGYEGKLEGNFIIYGCAKFNKNWFEELSKSYDRIKIFEGLTTKQLKSIKLDSDVEITIEQIKQIYEYIKSKD